MSEDWILEARNLSKSFAGFFAVRGVNLAVRRGSIHALIGPNGAGKTTCFNLFTKFLIPTSGSIHFNGLDVTPLNASAIAKKGMVRSFQISATFPHLSLLENVRLALQRKLGTTYFFWRTERSLDTLNEEALEFLDLVGLAAQAETLAVELSYGRKRALEIATTLAMEPRLLLLDEPMAGMGTEDIGRISALIRKVSRSRTILMVEHNLPVVAELCDRISVLRRGEILAEGGYEEVSRNQDVIEAYMGVDHAR